MMNNLNKCFNRITSYNVCYTKLLRVSIEVEERSNPSEYIFEPKVEDIIEEMIPKSLKVQMFKSILDSNAAEHRNNFV